MDTLKTNMVAYLDEPERILCFTVDEFMALMVPIAFGLKWHHLGWGLVLGVGLCYALHRCKADDQMAGLLRWWYWVTPTWISQRNACPPSYLRHGLG